MVALATSTTGNNLLAGLLETTEGSGPTWTLRSGPAGFDEWYKNLLRVARIKGLYKIATTDGGPPTFEAIEQAYPKQSGVKIAALHATAMKEYQEENDQLYNLVVARLTLSGPAAPLEQALIDSFRPGELGHGRALLDVCRTKGDHRSEAGQAAICEQLQKTELGASPTLLEVELFLFNFQKLYYMKTANAGEPLTRCWAAMLASWASTPDEAKGCRLRAWFAEKVDDSVEWTREPMKTFERILGHARALAVPDVQRPHTGPGAMLPAAGAAGTEKTNAPGASRAGGAYGANKSRASPEELRAAMTKKILAQPGTERARPYMNKCKFCDIYACTGLLQLKGDTKETCLTYNPKLPITAGGCANSDGVKSALAAARSYVKANKCESVKGVALSVLKQEKANGKSGTAGAGTGAMVPLTELQEYSDEQVKALGCSSESLDGEEALDAWLNGGSAGDTENVWQAVMVNAAGPISTAAGTGAVLTSMDDETVPSVTMASTLAALEAENAALRAARLRNEPPSSARVVETRTHASAFGETNASIVARAEQLSSAELSTLEPVREVVASGGSPLEAVRSQLFGPTASQAQAQLKKSLKEMTMLNVLQRSMLKNLDKLAGQAQSSLLRSMLQTIEVAVRGSFALVNLLATYPKCSLSATCIATAKSAAFRSVLVRAGEGLLRLFKWLGGSSVQGLLRRLIPAGLLIQMHGYFLQAVSYAQTLRTLFEAGRSLSIVQAGGANGNDSAGEPGGGLDDGSGTPRIVQPSPLPPQQSQPSVQSATSRQMQAPQVMSHEGGVEPMLLTSIPERAPIYMAAPANAGRASLIVAGRPAIYMHAPVDDGHACITLAGLPPRSALADDGATTDMETTLSHAVPGTRTEARVKSLQVGKKEVTVTVDSLHDFVKEYRGANGKRVVVARKGSYCPNGVGTVFSEVAHNRLGGRIVWEPCSSRVIEFQGTALECFTAKNGLSYLETAVASGEPARLAVRRMLTNEHRMGVVELDAAGAVLVASAEAATTAYSSMSGELSRLPVAKLNACKGTNTEAELPAEEKGVAMAIGGAADPVPLGLFADAPIQGRLQDSAIALDIFGGDASRSDGTAARLKLHGGGQMLVIDRVNGFDLFDNKKLIKLYRRAREGGVWWINYAFPCSPFAAARARNSEGTGPPVVTRRGEEDGIADAPASHRAEIRIAMDLIRRCEPLSVAVIQNGGLITSEAAAKCGDATYPLTYDPLIPDHVTVHDTSVMLRTAAAMDGVMVRFSQCAMAKPGEPTSEKPTEILMPRWFYAYGGIWLEQQQCPGVSKEHVHSQSLKGRDADGNWNSKKGEKWVSGLCDGLAKIAAPLRAKLIAGDIAGARVLAVGNEVEAVLPLAAKDALKPYRSFGIPRLPKLEGLEALTHLHLKGHPTVARMKATIEMSPLWRNVKVTQADWTEFLRRGCIVCDITRTKKSIPRSAVPDKTASLPGKRFVADTLELRVPSAEWGYTYITRFVDLTSHKKFSFPHFSMSEAALKEVHARMAARNRPVHGEMMVVKLDALPAHRSYAFQRFLALEGTEVEMSAPYRHEGVNVVEASFGYDVPRAMACLVGGRQPEHMFLTAFWYVEDVAADEVDPVTKLSPNMIYFGETTSKIETHYAYAAPCTYTIYKEKRGSKYEHHQQAGLLLCRSRQARPVAYNHYVYTSGRRHITIDIADVTIDESALIKMLARAESPLNPMAVRLGVLYSPDEDAIATELATLQLNKPNALLAAEAAAAPSPDALLDSGSAAVPRLLQFREPDAPPDAQPNAVSRTNPQPDAQPDAQPETQVVAQPDAVTTPSGLPLATNECLPEEKKAGVQLYVRPIAYGVTPVPLPGLSVEHVRLLRSASYAGAVMGQETALAPSGKPIFAVPSKCWPSWECKEHCGTAWSAELVDRTGRRCVLRTTVAKDAKGRPYEMYLDASVLIPLNAEAAGVIRKLKINVGAALGLAVSEDTDWMEVLQIVDSEPYNLIQYAKDREAERHIDLDGVHIESFQDLESGETLGAAIVLGASVGDGIQFDRTNPLSWHSPSSWGDYLRSPHREEWTQRLETKTDEYEAIPVWNLVHRKDVPKGVRIHRTRWVFAIKTDGMGKFQQLNPRFCLVGTTMDREIYNAYAGFAKPVTHYVLMALRVTYNLVDFMWDFKNFHQTTPADDTPPVYFDQPRNRVKLSPIDKSPLICKGRMVIQGRIDASRVAGKRIMELLTDVPGVKRLVWDRSTIVYHAGPLAGSAADLEEILCKYSGESPAPEDGAPAGFAAMALHADDGLLVAGPGKERGGRVEEYLRGRVATVYAVKVLNWHGEKHLGRLLTFDEDGLLRVDCKGYFAQLMDKFPSTGRPYQPRHVTRREVMTLEAGEEPDDSPDGRALATMQNDAKQLLAALHWASDTHKELKQPVNRCLRFSARHSQLGYQLAFQILHYAHFKSPGIRIGIKGATSLVLRNPTPRPWDACKETGLHFYCDANVEARSVTGVNGFLAGAAIIVISERQHVASAGPHTAETIAITVAVMNAIIVRGILQGLYVPQQAPTPIMTDSESARLVMRDARSAGRAAWLNNRAEFVQENQGQGTCDLQHVPGQQNPANSETKYVEVGEWARDTEFKLNVYLDAGDKKGFTAPDPNEDKAKAKTKTKGKKA